MTTSAHDIIRSNVRDRYAAAAKSVDTASCCGGPRDEPVSFGKSLYGEDDLGALPEAAARASLGCGNPTMLASLEPGEVVLDLGSGGGIDVLLSARRVGPTGKAYGLDMTPEMIALSRRNISQAGVANAEILEGTLEDIPLPDASVDVVISNCVINLSPDKRTALSESFRVLRPGGRFAVSDVVLTRPLPEAAQRIVELWAGCITGALTVDEYRSHLEAVGFVGVEIVPTLVHDRESLEGFVEGFENLEIPDRDALLDEVDGSIMNAFVRAHRPESS
ncbi:MAG TPA: arsenite methyltransferase [Acidimicrobiales bacterium]